ncbi:MAG: pyrimidine-nucleoside phosphorylase, partial [Pyrinomonadaceae bacterium]
AVGTGVCGIGGGRVNAEDGVDHAVGYSCAVKLGDKVKRGDELGVLFVRNKKQGEAISEKMRAAYRITKEPPRTTKLIRAAV